MTVDLREIFRRFGYDPDRPVGRDNPIPDKMIANIRKAGLYPEEVITKVRTNSWIKEEELTAHEKNILAYYSRGLTRKMVAEALGVADETIKDELRVIQYKMHAKNTTQAVCEALRRGLIK